jgi:hypothetical protein
MAGDATLKGMVIAGQPSVAIASCCSVMVPLAGSMALITPDAAQEPCRDRLCLSKEAVSGEVCE